MDLSRIGWGLTVATCAVVAIACVISGYQGYAGVTAAVMIAAAINLFE